MLDGDDDVIDRTGFRCLLLKLTCWFPRVIPETWEFSFEKLEQHGHRVARGIETAELRRRFYALALWPKPRIRGLDFEVAPNLVEDCAPLRAQVRLVGIRINQFS